MTQKLWHYEKNNQSHGPVSEAELLNLISDGSIRKDTLVWSHPMTEWAHASSIDGLKSAFPLKPPPLPGQGTPPPLPRKESSPFEPPHKLTPDPLQPPLPRSRQYSTYGAPPPPPAEEHVPQIRPWVRFFARLFDYYFFVIVIGIIFEIVDPDSIIFDHPIAYSVVIFFVWIFIESLFLSQFGATLGKMFLKTRVVDRNGNKPSYSDALRRSFGVWLKGEAIGFPIAYFVTWFISYKRLMGKGKTAWDDDGGFTVP